MAIFINYRRDDSQSVTGRIDDHLRSAFGDQDVYRDIDSILPGEDFVEQIQLSLQQCDICIAVMGPRWLSPRLAEENDFVRLELEKVLERRIPVIPVLVEDARLPGSGDIPKSLASLLRRQAIRIDSGMDFRSHIVRLVDAVRAIRARRAREVEGLDESRPNRGVRPQTGAGANSSDRESPVQAATGGKAVAGDEPGFSMGRIFWIYYLVLAVFVILVFAIR